VLLHKRMARTCVQRGCAVQRGVVCVLLEAPFYGQRRHRGARSWLAALGGHWRHPRPQYRWFLRTVHQSFVQSYAIAYEASCVLHWAAAAHPGAPVAIAGISWGGAMAALASRLYSGAAAVVPYMGCLGAGGVFAEGARSLLRACCSHVHRCERVPRHRRRSRGRHVDPNAALSPCFYPSLHMCSCFLWGAPTSALPSRRVRAACCHRVSAT
jgi:Alpha/beta hydrolase domain containing 18